MQKLKRIYSYAKEYQNKIIVSVLCATLSVIMGIVPYLLVHKIIIMLINKSYSNIYNFLLLCIAISCCLILKSILFAKSTIFSHECAYDILMEMRNKLTSTLANVPMGEIKKRTIGNLKNVFVDDIESMEIMLAHMIPEVISNFLAPAFTLVFIFILNIKMGLVSLATIPIGYFFYKLMMKDSTKKTKKYFEATNDMNSTIVEYINGMQVIKTFNQTTFSFSKYTDSVKRYRDYALEWHRYSWPYMAAYAVILPSTLAFVVPFGAFLYSQASLAISNYVLIILLSMGLTTPIIKLSEHLDNLHIISEKENNISEILSIKQFKSQRSDHEISNYNVKFKDVSFAYDSLNVLNNICFEAKENEVTALVGESGSGKSTIAKLLNRFWDVNEGEICIGDINIAHLSISELNKHISYVSQDIYLFNTTIKQNIRIGRTDATDEEVIEAAKIAQCHEFITELPQGYNTNVGDAGNKLSGGQKQRISIARALLKNTSIIVLDEATSFTDPENEDKIQEAINKLISNKTLIVIAHRLSTIVDANQILVIDKGDVVAKGSHEQLLAKSPLYKRMWNAHIATKDWSMSVNGGEK
ncbi:ABC transporter ATP-binding protein [Clostridium sp. 'deep sea']|uniref:ABC transporter ATP-binding protein n=1 Tax=Clostridium sp. 'deep sea' TaxID=2779445 RepID=UPI0018965043|nr:ABC transporter ATP-binding protein [Clostridium sp. 'deep sea']QOR34990.1 ABC transporter ATP-binding protein [Clostridium sp. 'deep sea']